MKATEKATAGAAATTTTTTTVYHQHPKWPVERFRALVQADQSSAALTLVAEHNRKLVLSQSVPIPLTLSLTCASILSTHIPIRSHEPGAKVSLWALTTDEAIWICHRDADGGRYGRIDVLNFANSRGVGGSYKDGFLAQEEQLCRIMAALWASLSRSMYPFAFNRELKYTPNVHVCREAARDYAVVDSFETCPRVGVITAAAPDLRLAPIAGDRWDANEIRAVLESVYRVPLVCEDKTRPPSTLIVGAYGCGAFKCDPQQMAQLFIEVTRKYRRFYRHIIFAIPDTTSVNYTTFQRALQEAKLL